MKMDNVIVKKKDRKLDVYLPYQVDENTKYVFACDAPLILDIKSIEVDGKTIELQFDPILYELDFSIDRIKTERLSSFNYIIMELRKTKEGRLSWSKISESLRYVIPVGNYITITYRVLLPFPFYTTKKIMRKDFTEKYYTRYYQVTIDSEQLDY